MGLSTSKKQKNKTNAESTVNACLSSLDKQTIRNTDSGPPLHSTLVLFKIHDTTDNVKNYVLERSSTTTNITYVLKGTA